MFCLEVMKMFREEDKDVRKAVAWFLRKVSKRGLEVYEFNKNSMRV